MVNVPTGDESEKQADVSQPEQAAESVDLATQLERVTNALLVPGGNPVAELKALDVAFAETGESASTFVDLTARRLLQQQEIFDNLNFQSSIITGGSSFFGMVIRKMGELIAAGDAPSEGAALPVQIRLVEQHRRGGDYEQMDAFAEQVTSSISAGVEGADPLALAQLAKVRYEQSMGMHARGDYDAAIVRSAES